MLFTTVLHPPRKCEITLACSSARNTVNARWRDHSLQPQSEKQNIKRVFRIFASCASTGGIRVEPIRLGRIRMGRIRLEWICGCCSPLFYIHRGVYPKHTSCLRVPQLATQYMIDDEEHLAVGKRIKSPYTHYNCYCWAATHDFAHSERSAWIRLCSWTGESNEDKKKWI